MDPEKMSNADTLDWSNDMNHEQVTWDSNNADGKTVSPNFSILGDTVFPSG